jgi:hypothetical protein
MKKLSWLFYVASLAVTMMGCRENEPAVPGKIRFTLSAGVVTDPAGRTLASLPQGASVYVSIRRVSGDEVYTLQQVTLLKMGDAYVSEPLALPGGNYELTDFLVSNAAGDVVYATPKEGADMASWVDDPLPVAFAVSDDALAQVDVEVVPVGIHTPEQFGYVSFRVNVVPYPFFKLSVFRPDSAGLAFSAAHAYVVESGDTLYNRLLPARTNDVAFSGNPEGTYTLVLNVPGHATYRRTFVLQELLAELNGEPLQVTLVEALTFTALPYASGPDITEPYIFWISMEAGVPQTPFTIDWGDGTVEQLYDPTYLQFGHRYPAVGRYHVSVSGDLASVGRLGIVFPWGVNDDVVVRALPELISLSLAWAGVGDSLDISQNTKLESLGLNSTGIQYFNVRNNPRLTYIELSDNVGFPPAVLNEIIGDVYHHAVARHTSEGWLELDAPDGSETMIGPLSATAMDQLRQLHDEYGWTIVPDPF